MMKNYDESAKINQNPNWLYILDHPFRALIIGVSGLAKTNLLLNLIKHQRPDINKIYLYVKDSFESNYQLIINGREKIRIKHEKIQTHLLIIHTQLMMSMKISIIQQ